MRFISVLCAAGIGAALMYFFDPDNGRHRRALLQDRSTDDSVLTERVRAALGRVVPDAHAIEVKVRDGCVTLKGPVTQEEVGEIVACTQRVRGVKQVENRLSPHSPVGSTSH